MNQRRSTILLLRAAAVLILLPLIWVTVALLRNAGRDTEPAAAADAAEPLNRPRVKLTDGFAGSDACRECHAHNHATWHASYHRTMTQVPTADNVVAEFDDVTLTWKERDYRLSRDSDGFWVDLPDPDAEPDAGDPSRVRRQIVLMTGSHHEQDFWFETPRGRAIQRLPFVYRIDDAEWLPDVSVLLTPPDSPMGFDNWNMVCIQCHTTLGRPRVDPLTGYATTEVVEFGIACEACHGPGAVHIARYESRDAEPARAAELAALDEIVNPAKLDKHRSVETCGQCHSVTMLTMDESLHWMNHGFTFRPGQLLSDSRDFIIPGVPEGERDLELVLQEEPHFVEDRFWSDGMVRVIGREANGILRSPCFERGDMTCLSCHELHPPADDPRPLQEWASDQLRLDMDSDRGCLQCHESKADALTAHTHHAADSPGSRCYNCHMPPTTYGLLKAIHSHQIDSPRLESSLDAGRPNACNLCHLDQSLAWADQHLADWYGADRHELTDEQTQVPASIVWALQGDAGQRALMAWAMAWPPAQQASGTDWQGRILSVLLNDPYDVVRFIARRSLRTLPGFRGLEFDILAGEADRAAAAAAVQQQWKHARHAAGLSEDLRELITNDAASAEDVLQQLQQSRNDRRVQLAE